MSEVDPARALEMAVAAAIMRTYGADSGATLGTADLLIAEPPRTTRPARCASGRCCSR